jgi:2-dehydropantoate 2-reductase
MGQQPIIHIVGLGAVGRLWAWHLLAAGKTVVAHGRQGVIRGRVLLQPDGVGHPLSEDAGGTISCLLVCVKAHQLADALTPLARRLAQDSTMVLAMNGMGYEDAARQRTPVAQHRLLYLVSSHGALASPADLSVQLTGRGEAWLGTSGATDDTCRQQWLNALACELLTGWDDNIHHRRWLKLGVNALINPVASLVDCRNGALLCSPVHELWRDLAQEFSLVARADGVRVDAGELLDAAHRVAEQTAGNSCSMREDLRAGRRSEIDHITGFVVARAKAHGVAVPHHQMLLNLVRCKEQHTREEHNTAIGIEGEHP